MYIHNLFYGDRYFNFFFQRLAKIYCFRRQINEFCQIIFEKKLSICLQKIICNNKLSLHSIECMVRKKYSFAATIVKEIGNEIRHTV